MSSSDLHLNQVMEQLRAGGQTCEELVEIFAEEGDGLIRMIYDGLDRLRVDMNNTAALADLRQSAHALKGAAGAAGFVAIAQLSHRMEDLLDAFEHRMIQQQLELLLATTDQIQDLSTGEVDFDTAAQNVLEIHRQFDLQLGDPEAERVPAERVPAERVPAESAADELFGRGFDEEIDVDPEVRLTARDMKQEPAAPPNGLEPTAQGPAGVHPEFAKYQALALQQLGKSRHIDPELNAVFSDEAEEHMRAIYRGLERLNSEPADAAALSDVRRSSHTIKGAAGAVGLDAVTRLAHRMEDLLDLLADRHLAVSGGQLELLLATTDRMQDLATGDVQLDEMAAGIATLYVLFDLEMAALGDDGQGEPRAAAQDAATEAASTESAQAPIDDEPSEYATPPGETHEDRTAGRRVVEAGATSGSGQYLRVPLERVDSLVALIGEMVVNRSAMSQRLADFQSRIQDMLAAVGRFRTVSHDVETHYSIEALRQDSRRERWSGGSVNLLAGGKFPNRLARNPQAELDALEFDRYTEFHLLARSLSEATSDMAVIANELRTIHGDFDSLFDRQQRFNRDAQDGLMHIRMLPVANIVTRLERTVRTVSNKLGKRVELIVLGENTELDKTVLEEITDPLLHLIRNALDHGIETSEQRQASGKSPVARLTIEALHQGTQVTLRVSDDGRGLDPVKIRNKAIEQRLINEQATLSEDELQALIFLPGFSTAESLTEISGRGVGMDVVREAVQRLKGTIRVDSRPGQGATFTIHLPTSLSVTRALIVSANSQVFAIPMQSVQQILRMDMAQLTKVGTQVYIQRGNKLLRLIDLSQHLELRPETASEIARTQPILLIRSGDHEIAVAVDAVKGGQDIVVKSLGDHLRSVPSYLGATFAGDGTVIPILDPTDLCGQKVARTSHTHLRRQESVANRRRAAMVIDDSLSVRRVTTNLLRSHGWDVVDAKDGVEALEKLAAADTPPDVFLCDMEMPRMDGLELVSRIRSMPELATTPVVMVTSRAGEKHRKMAAHAGADEYVVKPFKDDQLISLIDRLVSQHRELAGV